MKIEKPHLLFIIYDFAKKVTYNIRHTPPVIKKFILPQIFTWLGLYGMWLYFSLAISQQIFGLPIHTDVLHSHHNVSLLEKGTILTGIYFGFYQFVSSLYACSISVIATKISPRLLHGVSLLIGACGLMSIGLIYNPIYISLSIIAIGIMWGSIMTLPYAIVSAELSKKNIGIYLGIFNITITLPQILGGLSLGPIHKYIFHNHAVATLILSGAFIFIAGIIFIIQNLKHCARIHSA